MHPRVFFVTISDFIDGIDSSRGDIVGCFVLTCVVGEGLMASLR